MRRHLLDLVVLLDDRHDRVRVRRTRAASARNVAIYAYVFVVGRPGDARDRLGVRRRDAARRPLAVRERLVDGEATPIGHPRRSSRSSAPRPSASRTPTTCTLRLLPHLREIAQCRLERTGRTSSPETLGRWWELLRPDRAEPDDRFAPGIPPGELRALVADLERM